MKNFHFGWKNIQSFQHLSCSTLACIIIDRQTSIRVGSFVHNCQLQGTYQSANKTICLTLIVYRAGHCDTSIVSSMSVGKICYSVELSGQMFFLVWVLLLASSQQESVTFALVAGLLFTLFTQISYFGSIMESVGSRQNMLSLSHNFRLVT